MWLLTRGLYVAVAVVAFSCLMAALCWLLFGDGLVELRIWWRRRQIAKADQRAADFHREWNPRSTAMREFPRVRLVTRSNGNRPHSRDVISASQRMSSIRQR